MGSLPAQINAYGARIKPGVALAPGRYSRGLEPIGPEYRRDSRHYAGKGFRLDILESRCSEWAHAPNMKTDMHKRKE